MSGYVIIGGGAAGIGALEAIRSRDPRGPVHLVSDDPFGYYSRPGLAYYLTGELSEEFLFPFQKQDFQKLGVQWVAQRAAGIDTQARQVELQGGQRLPYERLLIATGAQANVPKTPGIELEGVVKLDNMQDARAILKLARKARHAVVVGGGITALELVEGLVQRGVRTHYFLRSERYWRNVLDETESHIVESRLKHEGVQIHYHTDMAEIVGKRGKVTGVLTQDGKRINCDLVAVAIGIRPRVELAARAGLEVERGVLVDEYMRTSDPYIYAAGDVAQVYDPLAKKHVLDSLWGPAREQGTTAGLNMAGASATYRKPVPFNVTRLAGLTTTIIGTVGQGKEDDTLGIVRGDSETWRQLPDAIAAQADFDVNRLRVLVGERTLVGAIVMGDQMLSRPLHQLILHQADISPIRAKLLNPGVPLGDILADFYSSWVN